jgi:diguanylate cyclase (GGDEF)-like protein
VLCLDLDGFKAINDTLGHAAGDALLKQFAGRLGGCLGPKDSAARMGGDEFAVLHRGGDAESALDLAASICAATVAPYDLEGQVLTIAVGIGIAAGGADGNEPDELLHNADVALYAAKRDGRGAIRCFEPELNRIGVDRRRLEADLRRALEHGEFELHFQPILNLRTHAFSGFEALLRWQHPERGLVPPCDFIPVAEDTGLIVPIGDWVIREALAEAARWPGELKIAVNVSSMQLVRGNLVTTLVQALAASGIAHERVEIEITESVFLENSEQSLDTLRQLRALGVRIALDDFGTGFSSLSYLKRFPFDKIKIDRCFVSDIEVDGSAAIVQAVVNIAAARNMTTTAEGVETEQQRDILRQLGCTQMQGYLFSAPKPVSQLRPLLGIASEGTRASA